MSSTKAHWDAVIGLIPEGITVYRGNVPQQPKFPYVLVWAGLSSRDAWGICDEPTDRTNRWRTTVSGLNEDSVMIVQDRVRDALDRARVTVPGWSPGRLRLNPLTPILEDLTVTLTEGRHPFYAVDEYEHETASA